MGKFPNTEPPREMVEKLLVSKRRVSYKGIDANFSETESNDVQKKRKILVKYQLRTFYASDYY